ncbi:MAG: hypothetical protein ACM3H8_04635 [Sphingobacteriales bacterium]
MIVLFILKVFAGVVYGYIYRQTPDHHIYADTWRFFYESKEETDLLFNNPGKYFTDLFNNPYEKGYQRLFSGHQSYWSDLKSNFMVKLVSVFNIFSLKQYYVNVIFYSFITFFGPVALYRLYNKIFPGKNTLLFIGCFLIPSFLYWCSGLHKDGFIFSGIAFIMYHIDKMTTEEGFSFKRSLYILLCLILIFPLRNYITVALLPAITAWLLSVKWKQKKWIAFSLVYFFFGTLFFTSRFINPKINLPLSVSMRQAEFAKLKGNSFIETTKLLPGLKSFVRNLPEALNHSLLRPYPTEIKSIIYIPAAIEVMAYLILFLLFIFKGKNIFNQPSVLFVFFFSFSLLILIGYIIPFIGAIVRYRSLLLPFLITPLLCSVSLRKPTRF